MIYESPVKMQKPPFLALIRGLARCYQSFESYSGRHVRTMDLTPCQFDIVATLGNTSGMNFRDLGEKTLTTKGTLTGVIERLKEKNIVQCQADPKDGRSQIVRLTKAGEALFAQVFPAHIAHMAQAFAQFDETEIEAMRLMLAKLGSAFR
jgi:DNA-binding MarR family transcriptional regulator